jgi:hypothetical protein
MNDKSDYVQYGNKRNGLAWFWWIDKHNEYQEKKRQDTDFPSALTGRLFNWLLVKEEAMHLVILNILHNVLTHKT